MNEGVNAHPQEQGDQMSLWKIAPNAYKDIFCLMHKFYPVGYFRYFQVTAQSE
jgi:hypothetical protein